MIGVHMDFHHILVGNHHDGITDFFQVSLKFPLILIGKFPFPVNDKFRAVPKFNVSSVKAGPVRRKGFRLP